MELLSPVMEAPPPVNQQEADAQLVAEAQAFEARLEEIRRFAATEVGKQAMIQAGMPEVFISDEEMGNPPITFIETSIARIALGGF